MCSTELELRHDCDSTATRLRATAPLPCTGMGVARKSEVARRSNRSHVAVESQL